MQKYTHKKRKKLQQRTIAQQVFMLYGKKQLQLFYGLSEMEKEEYAGGRKKLQKSPYAFLLAKMRKKNYTLPYKLQDLFHSIQDDLYIKKQMKKVKEGEFAQYFTLMALVEYRKKLISHRKEKKTRPPCPLEFLREYFSQNKRMSHNSNTRLFMSLYMKGWQTKPPYYHASIAHEPFFMAGKEFYNKIFFEALSKTTGIKAVEAKIALDKFVYHLKETITPEIAGEYMQMFARESLRIDNF